MNRLWAHFWAASIATCCGGMLLPACAHDDSTLYIQQIVAPPVPGTANGGCIYQAPSTQTIGLFSGALDVGLTSSYAPVALVGNQMVARGDGTQARTETNRVQLRGAVVRVTDSQGNQLSTFTSLLEGVVDPSAGQTSGLALVSVTVIDPATADILRQGLTTRSARKTVIAYFKVFGQTLGGVYVESGEFQHVVNVCSGCLVTFPADSSTAKSNEPANCDAPFATGAQVSGSAFAIPCVIGQDQLIDCRLCHNAPVCDPRNP